MKEKLILKEKVSEDMIFSSFTEAGKSPLRKAVVLNEDGIYLTFKMIRDTGEKVFGEIVCWVEDEFNEDPSLYNIAAKAAVDFCNMPDEEIDEHISKNDWVFNFTDYGKMFGQGFLDIKHGDIVAVYDEYNHDYIEHYIRVESVEFDKEYITETNPRGAVYRGTDLNEEAFSDDYITVVTESNFCYIKKRWKLGMALLENQRKTVSAVMK